MIEGNIFIYIHLGVITLSMVCVFVSTLYNLFVFDNKDESNYIMHITLSVICIVSMIFYLIGVTKCKKSNWVVNETPYAVEQIMSLNDNNLTNGRFYMSRGYIEENLYYQYMVKLNNGGFIENKVNSANATLFYAEDNYRVEWYTKTKSWLYWEIEQTYNKIFIPEGSIIDDYSIDLD